MNLHLSEEHGWLYLMDGEQVVASIATPQCRDRQKFAYFVRLEQANRRLREALASLIDAVDEHEARGQPPSGPALEDARAALYGQ